MAISTKSDFITASPPISAPAFLWIGAHALLTAKAKKWLQQRWCSHNGCGNCLACQQVQQEQHHAIIWINPEKGYTLEQLEIIHERMAFKLEAGQDFYFVLQKADSLTMQCSNSLLKSIEEPPAGYHFLLLAERADTILPTIRSRCQVEIIAGACTSNQTDIFMQFFTTTKRANPLAFLKELDALKISERESMQLVDQLFEHWLKKARTALIENKTDELKEINAVLAVLKQAYLLPPMPGSSKLFWKNLFVQIKR